MKVRYEIEKVAALRAGQDFHGYRVVEVPAAELSAEERAILARFDYPGGSEAQHRPEADFYLDRARHVGSSSSSPHWTIRADPVLEGVEAVRDLLRQVAAADAAVAAAKEAQAAEARVKYEAEVAGLLTPPVEDLIYFNGSYWDLKRAMQYGAGEDPRVAGRRAEAQAEVQRRNAEQRAREEAAAAAAAAEAKAERERRKAEKAAWVAEHGSDHLKLAVAGGYDCTRLYVTERAAREFPGFEIDFDDRAVWKDRSCPSEAALRWAKEVADGPAATAAGLECLIVWLTCPVSGIDEEDEEAPEPCEALAVRGFLGKYDLVRVVV